MFVRGMRGMRGLGDFIQQGWKEENWLQRPAGAAASIIPGVSNTTAAVGGGLGLAALAAAAWWFFGRK